MFEGLFHLDHVGHCPSRSMNSSGRLGRKLPLARLVGASCFYNHPEVDRIWSIQGAYSGS